MNRSIDRFLTTHTGSLPRPDDLIRTMFAKEEGVPVDSTALAQRVALAVEEVVGKQAQAGVDVIDDGEMSKPSYATYIKDRLTGFGGEGNTFVYQDLADFPRLAKRVFGDQDPIACGQFGHGLDKAGEIGGTVDERLDAGSARPCRSRSSTTVDLGGSVATLLRGEEPQGRCLHVATLRDSRDYHRG